MKLRTIGVAGLMVVAACSESRQPTALDLQAELSMDNAAPIITGIVLPSDPVQVGTSVNLTAAFTDANPNDVHTATVDWESASSAGSITEANGAGTVTGTHTYLQAGVYTPGVEVSDGELSDKRFTVFDDPSYIVVYDPSGGSVAGIGWIVSPPGAYKPYPAQTGKAWFVFSARYRPGATKPSGLTVFHTANLNFRSSSYEWLVVPGVGTRPQFKGEGVLNNRRGYEFLLTANDVPKESGEEDRFRIQIWEKASGDLVYESEPGFVDKDATTTLGAGDIVLSR